MSSVSLVALALLASASPAADAVPSRAPHVFAAKGASASSWLTTEAVGPQRKRIGVGAQIGYPTALTMKFLLANTHGLQFGAGVGAGWAHFRPVVGLHLDYIWHGLRVTRNDNFLLTGYVGGGVSVGLDVLRPFDASAGFYYYGVRYPLPIQTFGARVGARVPVGLSLALFDLPLEFYGELVPSVLVFPGIAAGLGGAVGMRVYL